MHILGNFKSTFKRGTFQIWVYFIKIGFNLYLEERNVWNVFIFDKFNSIFAEQDMINDIAYGQTWF